MKSVLCVRGSFDSHSEVRQQDEKRDAYQGYSCKHQDRGVVFPSQEPVQWFARFLDFQVVGQSVNPNQKYNQFEVVSLYDEVRHREIDHDRDAWDQVHPIQMKYFQ